MMSNGNNALNNKEDLTRQITPLFKNKDDALSINQMDQMINNFKSKQLKDHNRNWEHINR
jgi:hypothetical protein